MFSSSSSSSSSACPSLLCRRHRAARSLIAGFRESKRRVRALASAPDALRRPQELVVRGELLGALEVGALLKQRHLAADHRAQGVAAIALVKNHRARRVPRDLRGGERVGDVPGRERPERGHGPRHRHDVLGVPPVDFLAGFTRGDVRYEDPRHSLRVALRRVNLSHYRGGSLAGGELRVEVVRHRHSRLYRRRPLRLHRPFATPQTLAVLPLAKPVIVLASPLVLARPERPHGGPHGRAGGRYGARGQLQRRRTTRGRGRPPRRGLGPTRRRRRRRRDSIPRPRRPRERIRILVDDDDFPPRRRPRAPARTRLDPVPRRLVPRRRHHRGFRRRQGALRVPRRRDRRFAVSLDSPGAKALVHGELGLARHRRRGVLSRAVLGELEADAEAPTSLSRPGGRRAMRVARGWGSGALNERVVVVEKAATRGRGLDRPRRGPGAIGG
mmetsp:Transcript_10611/g.45987  ORF Transcript_10611/g.45987 Transcript_10611/m.45987 type:complete len:443 (+) Transcript_10611:1851-3179(+)